MEQILDILSRLGVQQLLFGLAVLFVGLVAVRLIMKLIDKGLVRFRGLNPALHTMLKTAIRFLLNLIVLLTAAATLGIPITSFVALLSVVSLAISLAVQGVLGNLAGGIIILASKPFTLGDFIESDSISGSVQDIGFLHTRLRTPDGKEVFVPNNLLYTSRVINYSASGQRRVELSISASYDNTPDEVRSAIMSAVTAFPCILADPAPQVLLDSYGDSAINYLVFVWVPSDKFLEVKFALNEALYNAFKSHGVEMTYPHMNVHMN